jgi:hypothetical protein
MCAFTAIRSLRSAIVFILCWPCLLFSQMLNPEQQAEKTIHPSMTPQRMPMSMLARLPLSFEENRGQADKNTRFFARGAGYALLLNSDGAMLHLKGTAGSKSRVIAMKLVGAQAAQIEGRQPAVTRTNYYLGPQAHDWRLDVPSYNSVVYTGIYRGIDLGYHGNGQQLEYDFYIAPGADPEQIRMRFEGLQPMLEKDVLTFRGLETLQIKALKAYQLIADKETPIRADWQIQGDQASIVLGPYDHNRELIIDPVFLYGSYIGGGGADAAVSIANGSLQGRYFVALSSSSMTIDQPAHDISIANPNCSGGTCGTDTLILEIQATTTDLPVWCSTQGQVLCKPADQTFNPVTQVWPTVLFATYLGGNTGSTLPTSIATDKNFNLYVTGSTNNPAGLPQVGTQFCSAQCSGYLAKLDSNLKIVYSLDLPSSGNGVTVDGTANTYVTGKAVAGALTIPAADLSFQPQLANGIALVSGTHAYLSEIGPTGGLLFSSYIGGSGADEGRAIALSRDGTAVYVTGTTSSDDFPVKCTTCQTAFKGGASDIFVLGISNLSSNPTLDYSVYLGGSGDDTSRSIAVDAEGSAVIAGSTTSTDFPNIPPSTSQPPPFQFSSTDKDGILTTRALPNTVDSGSQDGFVTSLSSSGDLRFTDLLGGSASTRSTTSANAVTLDELGVIYAAGTSDAEIEHIGVIGDTHSSTDFLRGTLVEDTPGGSPSNATTDNWRIGHDLGNNHIFLVQIDPSGQDLLQATIAGGTGNDQANGLAVGAYCFLSSPNDGLDYPACVGVASIAGSTVNSSEDGGLFGAAKSTFLYHYSPTPPAGDTSIANGFFVQEQLAGYCNMQLLAPVGTSLIFGGPCVAGTASGLVYVRNKNGILAQPPAAVQISGSSNLSPAGNVTLDLSTATGEQPFSVAFGFLPLGAIGAFGGCGGPTSGTGSITDTCGQYIESGGGGAGTIFNITSGPLAVKLTYSSYPNPVVVGQPVTLTADVTNGQPKTVTWSSTQGTFEGRNPATSIVFVPAGTGGTVSVQAIPVANPSSGPQFLQITTAVAGAPEAPLAIAGVSQMVAKTTYLFLANQTVAVDGWTADFGFFSSTTPGLFTSPDVPPPSGTVTITAKSTSGSATTKVVIFPLLAVTTVNSAVTLAAGKTAAVDFALQKDTGIPGESILFTCRPATMPTGVSCSFNPNPVINSNSPKITLTLSSGSIAQGRPLHDDPWKRFTLGGSSIVIAGCLLFLRPRLGKHSHVAMVACSALLCSLCLTACGSGGTLSSPSQPGHVTGTHVINIDVQGATANAADLNQVIATVAITLTIQ